MNVIIIIDLEHLFSYLSLICYKLYIVKYLLNHLQAITIKRDLSA